MLRWIYGVRVSWHGWSHNQLFFNGSLFYLLEAIGLKAANTKTPWIGRGGEQLEITLEEYQMTWRSPPILPADSTRAFACEGISVGHTVGALRGCFYPTLGSFSHCTCYHKSGYTHPGDMFFSEWLRINLRATQVLWVPLSCSCFDEHSKAGSWP